MEKGNRPPPDTEGTSKIPDIPAPPYPGPPLDPRVLTGQPNHPAAQNNAQYNNQPVSKSVHQQNPQPSTQPVGQQSAQPVPQQYPQPGAQQYPQPGVQQHPQPGAQQYPQPGVQQYPQPGVQQHPQPGVQQYPQPGAQQYPQPGVQQYPQPAQQPVVQYIATTQQNQVLHSVQMQVGQQNQTAQPVNPVVVVQARPTEAPGSMLCPHCRTTVVSTIEYKLGMLTWIIVGSLFIIGCWPCCLIPFCVSACKDVQHSCPQCNNVLHVHRRM